MSTAGKSTYQCCIIFKLKLQKHTNTGPAVARGIMCSGCLHLRIKTKAKVIVISYTASHSYESLEEIHYISYKHPFGLKDKLIRIWWLKVNVIPKLHFCHKPKIQIQLSLLVVPKQDKSFLTFCL